METRLIVTDRGPVEVPMGTIDKGLAVNHEGLALVSWGPDHLTARNGSRHLRRIDLAASGLGEGWRDIPSGDTVQFGFEKAPAKGKD
jgi:hypothetical protein